MALLIAPLAVPCIFGLSAAFRADSSAEGISMFLATLTFGSLFFYFAASCLGFPLYLLVRHFKMESLPTFAVGGALVGLAVGVVVVERCAPGAITSALAG